MTDKSITVEEYKEVGEDFWPKFDYVAQNIGEGAKPEDILKVMESLAGLVMKKRAEKKKVSLGFNKETDDE
jgi:hypothetical protein